MRDGPNDKLSAELSDRHPERKGGRRKKEGGGGERAAEIRYRTIQTGRNKSFRQTPRKEGERGIVDI